MYCSFQRHGFNSKAARKSHEKEHEKPWNCNVAGCEFENGGFLSRKMRDEHLDQFHNHHDILPNGDFKKIDEADFENVCLDLVKADDVPRIREVAAAGMLNAKSFVEDLIVCAAQYASPEMINILLDQEAHQSWSRYRNPFGRLLLPETVLGNNCKMLEYILHTSNEEWKPHFDYILSARGTDRKKYLDNHVDQCRANGLSEVLAKGNDEMLDLFCKWVEKDILKKKIKPYLVYSAMIAATAGDVYKEQILLKLWTKVPSRWWANMYWKNAILNVASTTCSINLAKFLIEKGVPVDWRNSKAGITSIVHAARKTNAEAAELVRFLLCNGAETVVEIVIGDNSYIRRHPDEADIKRSQIHVSEQKGARQISKWLGVSFDELVAQAKEARRGLENSDT
jgi:hypothetical protein